MATMEFQIRTALKLMDFYDNVDRGELSLKGIGKQTIALLLNEGWATLSHKPSGIEVYTITDAGRIKAAEEPPPPAPARIKLKTAPSRLQPAPPLVKPMKCK